MMGYNFSAPSILMWLAMVLIWVAAIGGTIWLFSLVLTRITGNHQPPAAESTLDILKRRYARGEISQEQFEDMRRELAA